jgi:integrase
MGRGGIRKRGKNYQIYFYDYLGMRHFETVGPVKKEAEKVLADRLYAVRNEKHSLDRERITFEDFASKWLDNYCRVQLKMGQMKESTLGSYQYHIRLHLLPYFSGKYLHQLTQLDIQEYIKNMVNKGLSPKTTSNSMVPLKEMLKHAIQWGYLETDPALYVKKPPKIKKEVDILVPEEIRAFLAQVRPKYYPLFLAAILTGMRQGELLGLMWSDIDFANMQIHIRRSLYVSRATKDSQEGERVKFVEPKSPYSRRAIDMAPILADTLKALASRFRGELVFCTDEGNPLDPNNLVKREFYPALRRAGLRHIPFHALRHIYASLLIAQGEHPKYIQVQLGHASIQITMDCYGHLMPGVNRDAPRRLEGNLFGNGAKMVPKGESTYPERRLTY